VTTGSPIASRSGRLGRLVCGTVSICRIPFELGTKVVEQNASSAKEAIMLKGYKTYIAAGVAIISALAMYAVGDSTLAQTAQLIFTAVLGAVVRKGLQAPE